MMIVKVIGLPKGLRFCEVMFQDKNLITYNRNYTENNSINSKLYFGNLIETINLF